MFLFGGIRTFGVWIRKAEGCFKYILMGHNSTNMEDNGSWTVDTQDVSEESISICCRYHLCDIVMKNLTAFGLCLTSLGEATLKNFELILLAEKDEKQPSIDSCVVISC